MRAWKTKIIIASLAIGVAVVLTVWASPFHGHLLNPGPMIRGHENVECADCHFPSRGTARQQIQANIGYWFGLRKTPVSFGSVPPGSAQCSSCHVRDNDPHALYRFLEPRFAAALKTVEAANCLGCHTEHGGQRVAVEPAFCSSCHDDLALAKDPLDVSHRTLVAEGRWSTCLGCHDYHGNHARQTQQRVTDAYAVETIKDYLRQGPDPFGPKRQPAKEDRP